MEDKLTLKSGRTLTLMPVKQQVIRSILVKMGVMGLERIDDMMELTPEDLLEMAGENRQQLLEASEQLFDYCAGWGVMDDPPAGDLAELGDLGFGVGRPHIARAHWLRLFVLQDDEEASKLIAAVMAHSARQWREMGPPQEQGELERLRARVAELEGEAEMGGDD